MSHCGSTVQRLKPDDLCPESFLTPAQRDQFIAVTESIHEAGVRYCAIRVDNLMLTEAGDPVIVDFDRARFNPIAVKEWEMDGYPEGSTVRRNSRLLRAQSGPIQRYSEPQKRKLRGRG
ncbi:hypothetical protein B0H14DRAFT_3511341 [Mycena olivaceomarginata]|nr:hypothetical protein B0H14DRAFT_3511341 [Mycena olivaceomarginata]